MYVEDVLAWSGPISAQSSSSMCVLIDGILIDANMDTLQQDFVVGDNEPDRKWFSRVASDNYQRRERGPRYGRVLVGSYWLPCDLQLPLITLCYRVFNRLRHHRL